MADTLVAKGSDAKYKSHPEGQFVAQCVDAIDLGERVEQFQGKPPHLSHKCALVFRSGEKNELGEYIDIAREFTVSMSDKANLRKFLEQWRGKKYTAEQVEAGVPLHKMANNWALITVEHRTSGAGRTYANIAAVVGVPQQMRNSLPSFGEYKRPDYWGERKKEYAEEAKKFRAASAAPPNDDFEEFPGALDDDEDSLPF